MGAELPDEIRSAIGQALYTGAVVGAVEDLRDGRRDYDIGELLRAAVPFIFPLIVTGQRLVPNEAPLSDTASAELRRVFVTAGSERPGSAVFISPVAGSAVSPSTTSRPAAGPGSTTTSAA